MLHTPHRTMIGIVLLLACSWLNAQNIIITGTVITNSGDPIKGAIIHLKGKGLFDTTASNGNFVITDITEIGNGNYPSAAVPPSLHNNILSVTTVKPQQKVALHIYNCLGKCISTKMVSFSDPGMHTINIFNHMQSASGIYFVKTTIDRKSHFLKTMLFDNSSIPSLTAHQNNAVVNSNTRIPAVHYRDTVDTIEVTAGGYITKNIPISKYILAMSITLELLAIDTIPPVIVLLGHNPMFIDLHEPFVDPGAIATDNIDGDITDNIDTSGIVDTTVPGIYEITYKVSDAAGNQTVTKRTVVVGVIDTIPPVIVLQGPNPVNLGVGLSYVEYGAYAVDDVDDSIPFSEFTVVGNVDTSQAGTYAVLYKVKDDASNEAEVTRTVNVLVVSDTIPPVITLKGSDTMTVIIGDQYVEPGATAVDNIDGDISHKIVITGTVNTLVAGTYTKTYSVSDEVGNTTTVQRTVVVTDIAEWQVGIEYNVGDLVSYNGQAYRCLENHTSFTDWEPPNILHLWQL